MANRPLGAERDPNKRILIFANGEKWPSDDSNDSTYIPPGENLVKLSNSATGSSLPKQVQDGKTKKKKKSKKKSKGCEDYEVYRIKKTKNSAVGTGCPKLTLTVRERKPKKKKVQFQLTDEKKLSSEQKKDNCPIGVWGTNIPATALLRIFEFVVKMEGALPFLTRAASVCKLWKNISINPCLWKQVDLSTYNPMRQVESDLVWMCENRFSQTVELNLTGWEKALTYRGIKAISENCPKLTSLNVSRCKNVTSKDIQTILDNCHNLHTIDLSEVTQTSSVESPVHQNALKYLTNKLGDQLIHISVANNAMKALPLLIKTLGESCSNLRVLDLSNINASSSDIVLINIENLQIGCPNLQILRLANTLARLSNVPLRDQVTSPGFTELEELSMAVKNDCAYFSGISDNDLDRILKTSKKLKSLDVRCCKHISSSSLVRLPAWDLEHLFMSQCLAASDPELELVMQKWQHSLIEVDLSWNTHNETAVDLAVNALASDPDRTKLQFLDVSGSSVSFKPLKTLLKKCQHLQVLNLSSCRGLPRGIKRVFRDDELDKLRIEVESDRFAD